MHYRNYLEIGYYLQVIETLTTPIYFLPDEKKEQSIMYNNAYALDTLFLGMFRARMAGVNINDCSIHGV